MIIVSCNRLGHGFLGLIAVLLIVVPIYFLFTHQRPSPTTYIDTAFQNKIIVDTQYRTLLIFQPGEQTRSFPVSVGKPRTPSPIGNWRVTEKEKWGGEFGTHWIGLNVPFGLYGIHGTDRPDSIGKNHSHGCIRMYNRDIAKIYNRVRIGTRVYIIGDPFVNRRRLLRGKRGSDVLFLQRRLKQLGFLSFKANGIFDHQTEQAVIRFQRQNRLLITGQIRWIEYKKLRLCGEECEKSMDE